MTHAKRGLTLTELLVVIAIIGIVAAMMLPAIHRAHNKAMSQSPWTYPINENTGQPASYGYTIYVIDGCEYVMFNSTLTHKGNCTNSIHSHNQ
jgi:prepilin-type N-terminal cleavage/methylation domain-containing protein